MRKFLTMLLVFVCAGGFSALQAQTFNVETGHSGPIVGLKGDLLQGHFSIVNDSDEDVDIKVTMLPNLEMGHLAYFCWDVCYAPTSSFLTSEVAVTLPAKSTEDSKFIYYLDANGIVGQSSVTFRFWDENDPTNQVEVTLDFSIVITDVEENLASMVTMNAFPSPATAAAYISYEMPESAVSQEAVVEISNVFGNTMESYAIRNSKGVLPIDVSNMAPGVYFYSILVDGVRIQSRKLVVKK